MKESGVKASDMSDTQRSDKSIGEASSKSGKKKTIIDRILKKPEQHIMSLAEKRQYATSVDAAAYFGKMIRSNFQKEMPESNNDEETEFSAPKYSKPSQGTDSDSLEACAVAENEGGEEDVRAALTCFFLHMYGDMVSYVINKFVCCFVSSYGCLTYSYYHCFVAPGHVLIGDKRNLLA